MSARSIPSGVPADRPVALLLRHAERPAIVEGHVGPQLSLTDAGRAASRRLGVEIGGLLRSSRTSPVRRCRETAELIREGAGSGVEILDDHVLGAPSLLVVDEPTALQNWERLGNDGVIEHLATSGEALPGMLSGPDAAERLKAHALIWLDEQRRARGAAANGLHLLVTHDSVVATLVSRLLHLGRPVWPDFLQGAALWRDGGELCLAYEDRVWPFPA